MLFRPLENTETISPLKYNAIVILSAGIHKSGLPDFRTVVRLKKGSDLYLQGKADKIICIGGIRSGTPLKSIAVVMKETLVSQGIPQQDILLDDETKHTYDDINHMLKRFREDIDFNNAVFVTSSYHTFRVKKILEKKGLTAHVISSEPFEIQPQDFAGRAELFIEVIREYIAVTYSWVKGWI